MAKASTTTSEPAAPGPDDFKTEQEKTKTKDPAGEAKESDGPAETMKLGPREPYPTGGERDPEADFEAAHGFKRAKE